MREQLVILTLILALVTATDRCSYIRHEYMKPEAVDRLTEADDLSDGNYVEVTCYFNGLWEVCPNPLDESRAQSLKEQYHQGSYISHKTKRLSRDDFDNCANWNS